MKRAIKKIGLVMLVVLAIGGASQMLLSRNGIKTIPVKQVAVQDRHVQKTVSANGEVKSHFEATLSFSAVGNIAGVSVTEGQVVKKGQLLAFLDNSSLYKDIQYYKDARDIVLRQKDRFVTEKEANVDALGGNDAYDIRLREYDEQISQAQAAYDSKVNSLTGTRIYAPFEGTVIDIYKKNGEVATAGVGIIKLADLNTLYFDTEIDQEDFGQIHLDQHATVTFDAFGDELFESTITKLPAYADGGDTPVFKVESTFIGENKAKALYGLTGDIKIVVAESSGDVKSLQYDELNFDDEGKPYVWVVKAGFIERHYVEVGMEGDLYTELKSEITLPIIVELNPDTEIKEGYKAVIVSKP